MALTRLLAPAAVLTPTQQPTTAQLVSQFLIIKQCKPSIPSLDNMKKAVSGKNVASDVNKAVTRTFPKNTYEVRAQPHAEGQVHFQRISDDTIRVFNVPDAFQDDRWTKNSAWAVAQANNYMDHPKVIKLSPADFTMLNLMKSKLTH